MKRRLISILMVSILILSLAGCKKEEKDKFVLGLDDTFAPMGFRDDNNNIVGFDIDLAQAVCDKLDMELVLQPIVWDSKEQELNTDNIDCIWNGLSLTDENKQSMAMTPAYMSNEISLVVAEDSTIASMADMAGKKLAIQSGSAAEESLNSEDNKAFKDSLGKVNGFDDYATALMDMDSGNSDAVLMDSVMANYYITEQGKNYKVLSDTLLEDNYAIGFRKDDQALCDKVWNTLKELKKDGKVAEISKKWFGSDITTIE